MCTPDFHRIMGAIREFLRLESAAGTLLLIAALIALVVANTPLRKRYGLILDTIVAVQVGDFTINKPLLLWVNDGLMRPCFSF